MILYDDKKTVLLSGFFYRLSLWGGGNAFL